MGRITGPRHSYGHAIRDLGGGCYRIHWTVDRKYEGSRLRFPTGYRRETDEDGARRFAKRHGIEFPAPTPA